MSLPNLRHLDMALYMKISQCSFASGCTFSLMIFSYTEVIRLSLCHSVSTWIVLLCYCPWLNDVDWLNRPHSGVTFEISTKPEGAGKDTRQGFGGKSEPDQGEMGRNVDALKVME